MKKFFQKQVPGPFGFARLDRPSHNCKRCEMDLQEVRRDVRIARLDLIDLRRELQQVRDHLSGFHTPAGSFPPDLQLGDDEQVLLVPAAQEVPAVDDRPAVREAAVASAQLRQRLQALVGGTAPAARYPTFYVPCEIPPTPAPRRRRHRGNFLQNDIKCV